MDGRIRKVVFDAPYAGSLELYSEAAGAITTLYSQVLGMRKRPRMLSRRVAIEPLLDSRNGLRSELDGLLTVGPDVGSTRLRWLTTGPTRPLSAAVKA